MEVETLTKEDIDELVNTGKLNWWEKKKAKMAQDAGIVDTDTPAQRVNPAEQTSSQEQQTTESQQTDSKEE